MQKHFHHSWKFPCLLITDASKQSKFNLPKTHFSTLLCMNKMFQLENIRDSHLNSVLAEQKQMVVLWKNYDSFAESCISHGFPPCFPNKQNLCPFNQLKNILYLLSFPKQLYICMKIRHSNKMQDVINTNKYYIIDFLTETVHGIQNAGQ